MRRLYASRAGRGRRPARLLKYRKFQVICGHKQTAFRDALRSGAAKLRGELLAGCAAAEDGFEGLEHLAYLRARFMHEFHAEVMNSSLRSEEHTSELQSRPHL